MPNMKIYNPEPITAEYIEQMKELSDKIDEIAEDMFYMLRVYGVWCKGKRAACYRPNMLACKRCQFYDGRGVGNNYMATRR